MLRLTLVSLLMATQFCSAAIAQEAKSITDAETVVAIYTNDWGLRSSSGPKLIVCLWGDGSIVWSDDKVNGGPPYFTAQVKPEVVSATFKKLLDIGVFDVPRLKQSNFGPDSKFTTILVRTEGKELKMDSWHELYESGGKVVAGEHGLTGLEGKKLLPVLAEQPTDYLHYRMTWSELRLNAANLIPKSGTESTGAPAMLRGTLSWESNSDRTKR